MTSATGSSFLERIDPGSFHNKNMHLNTVILRCSFEMVDSSNQKHFQKVIYRNHGRKYEIDSIDHKTKSKSWYVMTCLAFFRLEGLGPIRCGGFQVKQPPHVRAWCEWDFLFQFTKQHLNMKKQIEILTDTNGTLRQLTIVSYNYIYYIKNFHVLMGFHHVFSRNHLLLVCLSMPFHPRGKVPSGVLHPIEEQWMIGLDVVSSLVSQLHREMARRQPCDLFTSPTFLVFQNCHVFF